MVKMFENDIYLKRHGGRSTIKTKDGVQAVYECIQYLRYAQPVQPLNWNKAMACATKDHVSDIGSKGFTTHEGTDVIKDKG